MSNSWNWPGSRWWRVDLHTHTPESHDFKPDADREERDWTRWIEVARDAGLDAVAITDHNASGAIQKIQQAAKNVENAPVLFPGVEITANDGTHLLIVLDPGCSQAHVDALLTQAGIPVDQRGHETARSTLRVEELLKLRPEGGGLFIGAHVNGPNGLLAYSGQQRIAVLKHSGLAAVETDPTRPLDKSWIDGSRPEIEGALSEIWGSDCHRFDQAGRRFTWIKMTRLDAEGLRLALLDGSESLRRSRKEERVDPNKQPDLAIESITVSRAKYMGRREPLTVRFNPWLNAIIGGRGTGKSTLIDICRKTLRRDEELPGGGPASLRALFNRRMDVPKERGDEGLLCADTVMSLVYKKAGERYVLAWDQQGESTPILRAEGARKFPEEGEIRERFPVRIYSQKQLFDLATKPSALLTVIDDTEEVDGAAWQRNRKEAEAGYLSLKAEARSLRARADGRPGRKAALADVRRKIAVLEKGGHAKALNEYRTRRNQEGTWQSVLSTAIDGVDAVERVAVDLGVADLDASAGESDAEPLASLRRGHDGLRRAVSELRISVLAAVEKARLQIESDKNGADASQWRRAMEESEGAFRQVSEKLAAEGIASPDEYRDLLQRATTLEQEIAVLERHAAIATKREAEAEAELRKFRESREGHGKSRKEFSERTSGELIDVLITVNATYKSFEPFLREVLGLDHFDEDFRRLRDRVIPPNGKNWSFEALDTLLGDIRELLVDPGRRWDAADRRFVGALKRLQPERLDRLALYLPEDEVQVRFRDPRDAKKTWKHLAQGSPGQKTAALLAFVLGYGSEPILLDQPEDDLDNTLIYELLVQRLRETKATRQVIVVTHNSNIVVHGDAELVISLEAEGGQTRIAFTGGLQEQKGRDEICRVMEGGRDAFEARYRRIMPQGGTDNG